MGDHHRGVGRGVGVLGRGEGHLLRLIPVGGGEGQLSRRRGEVRPRRDLDGQGDGTRRLGLESDGVGRRLALRHRQLRRRQGDARRVVLGDRHFHGSGRHAAVVAAADRMRQGHRRVGHGVRIVGRGDDHALRLPPVRRREGQGLRRDGDVPLFGRLHRHRHLSGRLRLQHQRVAAGGALRQGQGLHRDRHPRGVVLGDRDYHVRGRQTFVVAAADRVGHGHGWVDHGIVILRRRCGDGLRLSPSLRGEGQLTRFHGEVRSVRRLHFHAHRRRRLRGQHHGPGSAPPLGDGQRQRRHHEAALVVVDHRYRRPRLIPGPMRLPSRDRRRHRTVRLVDLVVGRRHRQRRRLLAGGEGRPGRRLSREELTLLLDSHGHSQRHAQIPRAGQREGRRRPFGHRRLARRDLHHRQVVIGDHARRLAGAADGGVHRLAQGDGEALLRLVHVVVENRHLEGDLRRPRGEGQGAGGALVVGSLRGRALRSGVLHGDVEAAHQAQLHDELHGAAALVRKAVGDRQQGRIALGDGDHDAGDGDTVVVAAGGRVGQGHRLVGDRVFIRRRGHRHLPGLAPVLRREGQLRLVHGDFRALRHLHGDGDLARRFRVEDDGVAAGAAFGHRQALGRQRHAPPVALADRDFDIGDGEAVVVAAADRVAQSHGLIDHGVVVGRRRHRHLPGLAPALRREGQLGDVHGDLGPVGYSHDDGDLARGLRIEDDGVAAGFSFGDGQPLHRQRHTGRIGLGDRHLHAVAEDVHVVAAAGRMGQHHRIVGHRIVVGSRGDGHGLRLPPVIRGEGQLRRGDGEVRALRHLHRHLDLARGLRVHHHFVAGRAPLRDGQRPGRDRHAPGIVLGDRHLDAGRGEAVVVAAADREGHLLRLVGHGVVVLGRGDGDALRVPPALGGEGERPHVHGEIGSFKRLQGHRHLSRRLRGEGHGEGGAVPLCQRQ